MILGSLALPSLSSCICKPAEEGLLSLIILLLSVYVVSIKLFILRLVYAQVSYYQMGLLILFVSGSVFP